MRVKATTVADKSQRKRDAATLGTRSDKATGVGGGRGRVVEATSNRLWRAAVSTVVVVACMTAATHRHREQATAVFRHWLSAAAALWSTDADQKCAVTLTDFLEDVLRPPINCSYCQGLDAIEKVVNLSVENFEKHYAYTGRPVVAVQDIPNDERSTDFGFRLFKNLSNSGLLVPCQFFPYKTEFATLAEALNMDDGRARMESGHAPWYIGWSNCETKTINLLKKYINLPNFLPTLSDRKQTLWIFMGTPGHGAPMHIDKVGYPSWQTQISGYKKWTLRTPAECFFKCKHKFEVLMEPGSTIVLDTNIWYHETQTIGHDISITVGGEYD